MYVRPKKRNKKLYIDDSKKKYKFDTNSGNNDDTTSDCTMKVRMTEDGDTYESLNNTEELKNVLDESLANSNKARVQRTEKGEDENNKNLTENLINKPDEIENSEEGEEDQNNNDLTEDLMHSSDDTENGVEGDEENSEEFAFVFVWNRQTPSSSDRGETGKPQTDPT